MHKKTKDEQLEAIKRLNIIINHAGSVYRLCKILPINADLIYEYKKRNLPYLSERTASHLIQYAKKHRLKITMEDLRPHIKKYLK